MFCKPIWASHCAYHFTQNITLQPPFSFSTTAILVHFYMMEILNLLFASENLKVVHFRLLVTFYRHVRVNYWYPIYIALLFGRTCVWLKNIDQFAFHVSFYLLIWILTFWLSSFDCWHFFVLKTESGIIKGKNHFKHREHVFKPIISLFDLRLSLNTHRRWWILLIGQSWPSEGS